MGGRKPRILVEGVGNFDEAIGGIDDNCPDNGVGFAAETAEIKVEPTKSLS